MWLFNKENRQTYKCFVKNCSKSYFYVCTLKKHFENSHSSLLVELEKRYDTYNFTDIYKEHAETEYNLNAYISKNNKNMIEGDKVKTPLEATKSPEELEYISKVNQLAFLKQAINKANVIFNETRCQMERLKHVRNVLLSRKRENY